MKLTRIVEATQINLKETADETAVVNDDVALEENPEVTTEITTELPMEEPTDPTIEVTSELPLDTDISNPQPEESSNPEVSEADSSVSVHLINEEINNYWNSRERLLMLVNEIDSLANINNKESIKNLLLEISDDITISIGMLYKVVQLINPELTLLLDKGQNKASEVMIHSNNE